MPKRELITSEKFKGWEVKLTRENGSVLRASNFSRPDLAGSSFTQDVDMQFSLDWNATSLLPGGELIIKNVKAKPAVKFKRGDIVMLQAGWVPDQQNEVVSLLLAVEDIEQEKRSRSKTSFHMQVSDATFPMLTRGVSLSWNPGASAESKVFPDLVESANMNLGKVAPEHDYTYPNGFVIWGPLWHGLRQVAEDTDSFMSYWGNEINLLGREEGINTGFKLSSDNGVLVDAQTVTNLPHDQTMRAYHHEYEHPQYRLVSMLTSKIFPNAIYKVAAPSLSENVMTVRAIRGNYSLDGSRMRATNDVVVINKDGEKISKMSDAKKKAKDKQTGNNDSEN